MRRVLPAVSRLGGSDVVALVEEVEALPEGYLAYGVVGEEVDPLVVQVDEARFGGVGEVGKLGSWSQKASRAWQSFKLIVWTMGSSWTMFLKAKAEERNLRLWALWTYIEWLVR